MRRPFLLLAILLALVGCGNSEYDPEMCDFYRALNSDYSNSHGWTPVDVTNKMEMYCTR